MDSSLFLSPEMLGATMWMQSGSVRTRGWIPNFCKLSGRHVPAVCILFFLKTPDLQKLGSFLGEIKNRIVSGVRLYCGRQPFFLRTYRPFLPNGRIWMGWHCFLPNGRIWMGGQSNFCKLSVRHVSAVCILFGNVRFLADASAIFPADDSECATVFCEA